MKLREVLHQSKLGSELVVESVGVIPNYVEAAALGRPSGAKRCHDDMASGPYCMRDLAHVRGAVATLY